jgi:predicted transcriptional regulator
VKTGPTSTGEEGPNTDDESSLFFKILEKCKNGATKEELINLIPLLSHSNLQFRRSTAELVDRRLLNYNEKQHVFVTTDRGILFLDKAKRASKFN